MELGPVREHDRHRVAAPEAEPGEAGGGFLTLAAYSRQVIENSSPFVRSAQRSGYALAVAWNASATVAA